MIEFADGSSTLGRLEGNELETRPYRTARGTEVPARRWRVEVGVEGFTVRARG